MGQLKEIKSRYKGVAETWGIYWSAYGGFKALFRSPYLHFSFIITAFCWPIWGKAHDDWAWFDTCISVIPNILGFTLGGYAILLAFGDNKFISKIAGPNEGEANSPFMEINGTFIHFIIVQAVSIFVALLSLAWDIKSGWMAGIGFSVFIYALSSSVAAAFGILRLAKWFDRHIEIETKRKKQKALNSGD